MALIGGRPVTLTGSGEAELVQAMTLSPHDPLLTAQFTRPAHNKRTSNRTSSCSAQE